jgi:hypothetical protein
MIMVPDLEDVKPTEEVLATTQAAAICGLHLFYGDSADTRVSAHGASLRICQGNAQESTGNAGFDKCETSRLANTTCLDLDSRNETDIPAIYAEQKQRPLKVIFGIPLPKGQDPYPQTVDSLWNSVPLVEAAGFEHGFTYTAGNPYISGARAEITRKALDAKADIIVYIDYDVSWDPQDMVTLLKTEGDVVGGTYRCKVDHIQYMGAIYTYHGKNEGKPMSGRWLYQGAYSASRIPEDHTAGIDNFMRAYPELCYGPQYSLSVDLFHHGAHEGIWWGEDYAFCRNYEAKCGKIWLIPNLNIHHWDGEKCFEGNYHEFLLACPGGSKAA